MCSGGGNMKVSDEHSRYTIEDLGDTLKIHIPGGGFGCISAFLTVWLIPWAISEIFFVGEVLKGGLNISLLAFICVWTIGGMFAIYKLLWSISGEEIIEISDKSIVINRIAPIFSSRKEYFYIGIGKLFVHTVTIPSGYDDSEGKLSTLTFWYNSQKVTFGNDLNEKELNQVIKAIAKKFPKYV